MHPERDEHAPASLVWFRDDLRLSDNPALSEATRRSGPVIALFVLDEDSQGLRPLGGAARWWLHHSLSALARALARIGVPLVLRRGPAERVVPDVARDIGASHVFWNRRYRPQEIAIDRSLMQTLKTAGLTVASYRANLLFEPWEVRTRTGDPFRVFTPFWKAARGIGIDRKPLPAPGPLAPARRVVPAGIASDSLDDWGLLPTAPDWSGGIAEAWTPGETAAQDSLADFLEDRLARYDRVRDRPEPSGTSRLSPHLRFGEISPLQVWHAAGARPPSRATDRFLAEIGWREFCWHLLHHAGDLATRNFNARFDRFPWRRDETGLRAWQRGQTGYPIVDAGMRQLWQTGWMHNRVRMVAASFLVKHLLVDWREGETWFWDTLVDADPANNPAGWQWVAGSGADAAPYFRIFNPVLQGEKFDTAGGYVRRWVPEIAALPDRWLHKPWEAPDQALAAAGIETDVTYPRPIVDHAAARTRALEAYAALSD